MYLAECIIDMVLLGSKVDDDGYCRRSRGSSKRRSRIYGGPPRRQASSCCGATYYSNSSLALVLLLLSDNITDNFNGVYACMYVVGFLSVQI